MMKNFNSILGLMIAGMGSSAFAADCTPQQLQQILQPATAQNPSVILNCSVQLPASAQISKQLIFEGESSSNVSLDCNGAAVNATYGNPSILIRSTQKANLWSVPKNIQIQNCKISGALRIHGMASNGEGKLVRESSYTAGHTQRVQQAAPSQIKLDNLTLYAGDRNMMYFTPGVNHVTLSNSKFQGKSSALALYLDAESAHNVIENNTFDVQTNKREIIAVDGSAHNVIRNNQFINPLNGAVFLYRNCGEGGTIRHQTPSYNQIVDNQIQLNKHVKTSVLWLGSRNGNRNYCGADAGYAFGSSQSDLDYAENNQVSANQVQLKKIKWYEFWIKWAAPNVIRVDSMNNQVANNKVSYR